jgi:predicted membrane protein
MRRDQKRQELDREIQFSTHLAGDVGETFVGDITVMSSYYSQEYDKFKIQARMGDSFVDFWYKDKLEANQELRIKGKIKAQRANNTTQLNYVKKV